MKDFYFLLDGDIIKDVVEYQVTGYVLVTIQDSLPPGVNAGYYRLVDGFITLDEALKEQIDKPTDVSPTGVDVLGMEYVKLDLALLNLKRQVASLTSEMTKKNTEIAGLTEDNKVLGSLLSSLQAQVLAIKGGTDVNV